MTAHPSNPLAQYLNCPHCDGKTDFVGNAPAGASVQCSHCRKFFQVKSHYSTATKVFAIIGLACIALMFVSIGVFSLIMLRWSWNANPIAVAPTQAPVATPVTPSLPTPTNAPPPTPVEGASPIVATPEVPVIESPPSALSPKETGPEVAKLRYGWKEGESYEYRYSIQATVLERQTSFTGFSTYTAQRPKISQAQQAVQSSGTGFVISSDGYLLTCHHLIDGATQIDVILGGKTYAGRVVGSDRSIDIALVKIDAAGLTPLSLAEDKQVQLGQELTSVGYPLSSVLGESVKVNRGSMAGVVKQFGRNLIQVDASINPGNSGGPVVDNRGRVVGMATEKLYGSQITNVGLCLPSGELRRWLVDKPAQAKLGSDTPELSSTDLAKLVIPSVALLKVSSKGPSVSAWELKSSSMLFDDFNSSSFSLSIPDTKIDQGKLLVDDKGEVISDTDALSLPMMLGPVAALTLEPLPTDGRSEWRVERQINILRQKDQPSNSLMPRSRRRILSPFDSPAGQPKIEVATATETLEYKVIEFTEKTATIEKQLKISTQPGQKDGLEITLYGKLTFDRERGVMDSGDLEGSYTLASDSITVRVPLKISYEPFDSAKVAGESRKEKDKEKPQVDPIVKKELDQLSSDNVSRDKVISALQSLTAMKRDNASRSAVVDAVGKLLKSSDSELRVVALKTLAHWDWSTLSKDVIQLLDHSDTATRAAAIAYLGEMQDGEAAAALCERLSNTEDCEKAVAALKEIGAAAEEAVIKMLKHRDAAVQIAACEILADIGGQESVVALRILSKKDLPASAASKAVLQKMGVGISPSSKEKVNTSDNEDPFTPIGDPAKPKVDDNENPFEAKPKPTKSIESKEAQK